MSGRNPIDYSKELEVYKQNDSAKKMSGRSQVDFSIELESQFILRLPEEPAKLLREILQCGVNIKDRLTIQIEPDMRCGQVRFDHWLMHAKIVDLPCIVESLKTIDNKSFYKTADICQMMICKMEPDPVPPEEESTKNKKKDPYKVDKKFLYPHGLTPPAKNVRKRRFRKTLKKKFVEAPEIEKEVKRLLRSDCEAVGISWEVITEEDNGKNEIMPMETNTSLDKKSKEGKEMKLGPNVDPEVSNVDDIFGGGLSDSDLDDDNINVEMEDTSRLSTYDSRLSDSSSMPGDPRSRSKLPTQFRPDMFQPMRSKYREGNEFQGAALSGHSRSVTPAGKSGFSQGGTMSSDDDADYTPTISKESIVLRMDQLKMELEELKQQKHRTQQEIIGMENQTLRQRFQDILQNLEQGIISKEMEYQDLQTLQQQAED